MGCIKASMISFFLVYLARATLGLPDSNMECVNDLIDLCNRKDYSVVRGGINAAATDSINGTQFHVLCLTEQSGTNCTINGSPYLFCSSSHELFYKGKPLKKNSVENADDDICYLIDLKAKINKEVNQYLSKVDSKLQGLNANLHDKADDLKKNLMDFRSGLKSGIQSVEENVKSNVKKGLDQEKENLNKGLSHLQDNLSKLGDKLSRPCFPFCKEK